VGRLEKFLKFLFKESYWSSIYQYLLQALQQNEILNATNIHNLLDYFDLYLAAEKQCINQITILIALFHAILTHSNAIHFQYFVKYLSSKLFFKIVFNLIFKKKKIFNGNTYWIREDRSAFFIHLQVNWTIFI
jgi:hypothetical protein